MPEKKSKKEKAKQELIKKKKKLKKKEEEAKELIKEQESKKEELTKKKEKEIAEKFNQKIEEIERRIKKNEDKLAKKEEELRKEAEKKIEEEKKDIEEQTAEKEERIEKEIKDLKKDILKAEKIVYSRRQRSCQIIMFIFLIYLFIIGIIFIKESVISLHNGALDLIPSIIFDGSAGFSVGWISSLITQSGSAITFLAVALAGSGVLSFWLLFFMLCGIIIGNTSTPLILNVFTKSKNNHELRHGFEIGLANLVFSSLLILLVIIIELITGLFTFSAGLFSELLADLRGVSFIPGLFEIISVPIMYYYEVLLGFIGLESQIINFVIILTGFAFIIISLKYLAKTMIKFLGGKPHARSIINKYFSSRWNAFLIGFGITIIIPSSSLNLSLLVPLAVAGLIDLRKAIPFAVGANIGVFIDVLLASLATGLPLSIASALMFSMICVFGMLFVVHDAPVDLIHRITRFLSLKVFRINRTSIIIILLIMILTPLIIMIL